MMVADEVRRTLPKSKSVAWRETKKPNKLLKRSATTATSISFAQVASAKRSLSSPCKSAAWAKVAKESTSSASLNRDVESRARPLSASHTRQLSFGAFYEPALPSDTAARSLPKARPKTAVQSRTSSARIVNPSPLIKRRDIDFTASSKSRIQQEGGRRASAPASLMRPPPANPCHGAAEGENKEIVCAGSSGQSVAIAGASRKTSMPVVWKQSDKFTLLDQLGTFFQNPYQTTLKRQKSRVVGGDVQLAADRLEPVVEERRELTDYEKAILKRESIRFDPKVISVLNQFWKMVNTHEAQEEHTYGTAPATPAGTGSGLSREAYLALSIRMQKAELPKEDFTQRKAMAVAEAEWIYDNPGKEFMDKANFYKALFQAAAAWADSETVDAYCAFLWGLFNKLARTNEDGSSSWRWAPRPIPVVAQREFLKSAPKPKREKPTNDYLGLPLSPPPPLPTVSPPLEMSHRHMAWKPTVAEDPPIKATRRAHPFLRAYGTSRTHGNACENTQKKSRRRKQPTAKVVTDVDNTRIYDTPLSKDEKVRKARKLAIENKSRLILAGSRSREKLKSSTWGATSSNTVGTDTHPLGMSRTTSSATHLLPTTPRDLELLDVRQYSKSKSTPPLISSIALTDEFCTIFVARTT